MPHILKWRKPVDLAQVTLRQSLKQFHLGVGSPTVAIFTAWLLAVFMAAIFFMTLNFQLKEYCVDDELFVFKGECK